ncbi:MAG: hypothetical protein J1E16_00515 [Muribaculaceae bacterium]|nr:hypothetical protein [Muribaculaceae bacterium]
MEIEKIKQINQEILKEDFATFDSLTEPERIEVMKSCNRELWIKFRMRNTVTEEEVFDPLFKMIEVDN